MQKWWKKIRYFKPVELASKDDPKSGVCMDFRFMFKLDAIRHDMGCPFDINSGFRTPEHNAAVGGAENSPHVWGRAVDISTVGWEPAKVEKLKRLAKQYGMTGFGLAKTFVHLDDLTAYEAGTRRPLQWDYLSGKAGNYKPWIG